MPIKKIRGYDEKFLSSMDEERTEENFKPQISEQQPYIKNKVGWSIIIFVLLFAINIIFSSYTQYNVATNQDNKKSLECLLDYTSRPCNPMKMSSECSGLYECIKQDEWNEMHEQLIRLLNIIIGQIKEQFIFPSVVLIIMFLFELTNRNHRHEKI